MGNGQTSNVVRFGVFQADLRTGELRKAGLRIRIQEQPFKILVALLEKPSEVVTREELRQRIWPRESFGDLDHAIDLAIGKLRATLGDSACTPRFIETLPRRGYRFLMPVALEATGEKLEPTLLSSGPIRPRPSSPFLLLRWKLVLALAVLVLAVAGIAAFRSRNHKHAWRSGEVLVAQFENRTGEPALDGSLEYALEHELGNSELLKLAPPEQVQDILRLMRKPANAPLDLTVAREVCVRDGSIHAVITGRVERLGLAYLLAASIVEPTTGRIVYSVSEEAESQMAILPAIRRLSNQVRAAVGESLAQIEADNARLEKATTPSLRALRLYSHGMVFVNDAKWGSAAELLEQAVAADLDFASAHIYLAHCYSNMGNDKKAEGHYKRAFELADTTTDQERYFILGSYYARYLNDDQKAMQVYEVLVRLYPDHYWGQNNLLVVYKRLGRYDDAVAKSVQQAQLRPNDFISNVRAWSALENWKRDSAAARPYFETAQRLLRPEIQHRYPGAVVTLEFQHAYRYLREGNPAEALGEADRLAAAAAGLQSGEYQDQFLGNLGDLYLCLGKLQLAEKWFRQVSEEGYKHLLLEGLAEARGDREEFRRQLLQQYASGGEELGPGTVERLARAGLLREARTVVARLEKQRVPEMWLDHARGAVDVASGRTAQGIQALENAVKRYQRANDAHRFMAGIALAEVLDQRGDTSAAIEVLQPMMEPHPPDSSDLWLDFRLAGLYRKVGKKQEAERLESRVLNQLAYADADDVILTQLQHRRDRP